jgi:hypothetical protein
MLPPPSMVVPRVAATHIAAAPPKRKRIKVR